MIDAKDTDHLVRREMLIRSKKANNLLVTPRRQRVADTDWTFPP